MFVRTQEDVDRYLALVRKEAADTRAWMVAQTGDPLDMLRRMKFDATKARGQHVGYPPALTPQHQEARERRDNGATLSELAKSYNVGMATISRLSKKVAA